MNLQELRQLLDKYYEGTSSLQEETILISLLNDDNLPAEFAADRRVFALFGEERAIPQPDDGFEGRIMGAIDKFENRRHTVSLKRTIYSVISVAASLLIVVISYFIIYENRQMDSFDDPLIAYNETMKVLYNVSVNLNKGSGTIEELAIFDVARSNLGKLSIPQEVITSEMSSLRYIEKGVSLFYPGDE